MSELDDIKKRVELLGGQLDMVRIARLLEIAFALEKENSELKEEIESLGSEILEMGEYND